jgi:hypothetical protein
MSYLGLAWLGLAWLGLAWLGLAWLGLAWLVPFFCILSFDISCIAYGMSFLVFKLNA